MSTLTCTVCKTDVVTGEAVIRSVLFEQVAWHPHCWDVWKLRSSLPQIPIQRSASVEQDAKHRLAPRTRH